MATVLIAFLVIMFLGVPLALAMGAAGACKQFCA